MAWVILVHCLYWIGLFSQTYRQVTIKSFFLIEMPIMFFAIGASNSFSKIESLWKFWAKRLKRVYFPYLVYVLICWLMTVDVNGFTGETRLFYLFTMMVFPISVPSNANSALWFIPYYCIFIFLFPLFKFIYVRSNRVIRLIPLIGFWGGIAYCTFHPQGFLNYFFTYGFWVYLGLFYQELIKRESPCIKILLLILSIANLAIVFGLHKYAGISYDMQANKFPPNLMFNSWTLAVLSYLAISIHQIATVLDKIKRHSRFAAWLGESYERCSYSIFLMQPFAFALIPLILNFMSLGNLLAINNYISFIIYLTMSIPIAAVLGRILYPIEKKCNS